MFVLPFRLRVWFTGAMNGHRNGLGRQVRIVVWICFGLALPGARGADWPQWRGPQRDGLSRESALLKEWPKEGPVRLWQTQEAGRGYSTPAVVGDFLYLLGNDGTDHEFVEALSAKDGKRIWTTALGKVGNPDQQPNFPGARSTPTLDGDNLYALSSDGDLVAVTAAAGAVLWRRNLRGDFHGKPGTWAYSESPLIDGDTLVCTPGGRESTVVALNKRTGALLWKAPTPAGDDAAYASAIVVEADGVKQYVQMLQKGLVGFGAADGKILWRYERTVSRYGANIPTPVARGGEIYSSGAGTGGGLVRLSGNGGGLKPEEIYFSPKLPTAIGGAVLVGDYLYGANGQGLECVNFKTGTIQWEDPALGATALCYADGLLFLHSEGGEAGLVEARPDGYHGKGRFKLAGVPERSSPMEKAWTYPVVANGRLYLRDHSLIWCYDIRASSRL